MLRALKVSKDARYSEGELEVECRRPSPDKALVVAGLTFLLCDILSNMEHEARRHILCVVAS